MDWPIQEIARITGITSRTLRHYDRIGLLPPERIGANGYRYYGSAALVRLQRILLLRELGLGLKSIGEVLDRQTDPVTALRDHLAGLRQEQDRLGRQIASLESTLRKLERREPLMAEEMFNGFDHTQYKDEVIERWGQDAWDTGNDWWSTLSDADKQAFQQRHEDIARDFGAAHEAGKDPASDEVQAIARRHHDWLAITNTPVTREYLTCLGDLYVNDPRFAINYDKHGEGTAALVRDALRTYAERNL